MSRTAPGRPRRRSHRRAAISVAAHLAVPASRPHQGIQLGMEAL